MVYKILDNYQSILTSIKEQTNLDESEIEKKVNEKIQEFEGFLLKAGAIYAVAKENKVETEFEPEPAKAGTIHENQLNLRLKARVIQSWPLVEFNKGIRQGCVQNFLIEDDTGKIRLVVWNDKEVCDKIQIGQELIVSGAYSKLNNNFVEVHASNYANIKLGEIKEVEKHEKIFTDAQVGDIISGEIIVRTVYPTREFTNGKVRNLIFDFQGKQYNLVFWNDKVNLAEQFQSGEKAHLENVITKTNRLNGNTEFHLSQNSAINKII